MGSWWLDNFFLSSCKPYGIKVRPLGFSASLQKGGGRAGCGVRVLTSRRWLAVVVPSCHPALTLAGSLALLPFSAPLCHQLSPLGANTVPQTILSVSEYWLALF